MSLSTVLSKKTEYPKSSEHDYYLLHEILIALFHISLSLYQPTSTLSATPIEVLTNHIQAYLYLTILSICGIW